MRLRHLFPILLALLLITMSEDANAQRKNKYQKYKSKNKMISGYRGGGITISRFRTYYYGGVTANALNYFGDLAPLEGAASTDISFTRPGLGLFYGYKFHHSMAVRAAINYGRLFGDDSSSDPSGVGSAPNRYARNLSFRNDIKELSLGLEIYLLPNYGGPQSRPPLNAYIFVGAAVYHHEPKGLVPDADYQTAIDGSVAAPQAGEWVNLRELGTEGQNYGLGEEYGAFQFAIPLAVGGELYLNSKMSIGLEFGYRKLFFDHLDDVSGTYADLGIFDATDNLARILSDRAAEPIAVMSGDTRDIPAGNIRTYSGFAGGATFYHNGNSYTGLPDNDRRGSSDDDSYFMTQIRFTYIFDNSGGKAKFR
ncbi:MAG: hypothetical protein GY816_19785 [Cytophagales bacterium]|nr:hypothetical protein [Cytophagales bacterium]